MSDYKHPYRDAEFILNELVGFDQLCADAGLEDINSELADVILTEAGKLGADVLAPLNYIGDTQGATLSPRRDLINASTMLSMSKTVGRL